MSLAPVYIDQSQTHKWLSLLPKMDAPMPDLNVGWCTTHISIGELINTNRPL